MMAFELKDCSKTAPAPCLCSLMSQEIYEFGIGAYSSRFDRKGRWYSTENFER